MHHLQTLGALSLRSPNGDELRAILAQPKRLALLVFLAIDRPRGYHRRDTLLGIFWPDMDQEHARGALSRAVYYLRRSMGEAAIRSRGDELALGDGQLRSDVVEFETALDAGSLEEALQHYQGDLLPGFYISDTPEFERWLDGERARLRLRATTAAATLADRETVQGNLPLALHWARRATRLAPLDEGQVRRVITLLSRTGDRAGALHVYEELATQLQEAVSVEPSAETKALLTTVRSSRQAQGQSPLTSPVDPRPPELPAPLLAPGSARRIGLTSRWLISALVVGVAVAIGVLSSSHFAHSKTRADPNMIAVLPFHVTGDSSLAYLHEGMLDLLSAKLTGEGGPYATDPLTVMHAWRRIAGPGAQDLPLDSALQLARQLGAGQLLLGTIVGTSHRLILNASLLRLPGGKSRGTATVEGPPDSLLALVDRLTAQVLARDAGEDELRLTAATTSLPALRLYLDGQAEYRRGHYGDAATRFAQALAEDSAFALAALGLAYATAWHGLSPETRPAWALRARLSARDRAILAGLVGPRYPDASSEREFLSAWQAAVKAAPTRAEAWYALGDEFYHAGDMLGEDRSRAEAMAGFRRAVELDSGFAAPLFHLVELAAQSGDAEAVRRVGSLYLAVDSIGELADYLRWRVATALGDSATLTVLRSRMSTMGGESLRRIMVSAQLDGIPTDDADRAGAIWARFNDPPLERWLRLLRLHDFALNRGAPSAALAWTDSLRAIWPRSHAYLRIRVYDALYAEGNETAAAKAIDVLSPSLLAPTPSSDERRADQYADLCAVQQWRLAHGDTSSAALAITRLLSSSKQPDSTDASNHNRWCVIVLQALLSAVRPRSDSTALQTLDSLLLTGPREIEILSNGFFRSFAYDGLVVAQLDERAGNLAGALAAARRRPYQSAGTTYLSSYLLREGHLAALTGDRAGAIRAYRHYLTLRPHPEQTLEPEVAAIRTALAKLEHP